MTDPEGRSPWSERTRALPGWADSPAEVDRLDEDWVRRARDGAFAEPAPAEDRRVRFFSAADFAEPDAPPEWLVKGLWLAGSHGVFSGPAKSFKTHNAMALAVAVATGRSAFDEFEVPEARPVLYLAGEGGLRPTKRLVRRMAKAYGVAIGELTRLHLAMPTGSLDGEEFADHVRAALADFRPALVIVDPLYAFHPEDVDPNVLTQRGRMFTRLSALVTPEVALIVVDHNKKDVDKLDLSSPAGVGVAQWSDSFAQVRHKREPDVEGGRISLEVAFGSRQTGGRKFDLDWEIGRFDEDTLDYDGDISWAVRSGANRSSVGLTPNRETKIAAARSAVFQFLEHSDGYTGAEIEKELAPAHTQASVREALKAMRESEQVFDATAERPRNRGEKTVLVATKVLRLTGVANEVHQRGSANLVGPSAPRNEVAN